MANKPSVCDCLPSHITQLKIVQVEVFVSFLSSLCILMKSLPCTMNSIYLWWSSQWFLGDVLQGYVISINTVVFWNDINNRAGSSVPGYTATIDAYLFK